jgi:hypothetical protein
VTTLGIDGKAGDAEGAAADPEKKKILDMFKD